MSLTHCPKCGDSWASHATACKPERIRELAASTCSEDIRQRLSKAIFLLSCANREAMSWEAHNQIERAMIEVGRVRDRIPQNDDSANSG